MFRNKDIISSSLSSSSSSSLLLSLKSTIESFFNNNVISIKGYTFDKNDVNKQIIRVLNTNNIDYHHHHHHNHNHINNSNSIPYSYTNISVSSTVYLKESSIKGGGTGVFASNNLSKGTCVSLYPGTYIPPKPHLISITLDGDPPPLVDTIVNHNLDENSILESNAYSIHCSFNGGTLDACYGSSSSTSLAHLINHPPKGKHPNVVAYDFIWDDIIDNKTTTQSINKIASKAVWYIDPVTMKPVSLDPTKCTSKVIGIVFIAIKDIMKDEELFFNYNYEPIVAKRLPWYNKVIY